MEEKLLELISQFGKITGYNVDIENQLYFYMLPMNVWKLIKNIFTITKKIKYAGVNLTKPVWDLYARTTRCF